MHESPNGDFEHELLTEFRPSVDLPATTQTPLIDMARPRESAVYRYMPTFGEAEDSLAELAAAINEAPTNESHARVESPETVLPTVTEHEVGPAQRNDEPTASAFLPEQSHLDVVADRGPGLDEQPVASEEVGIGQASNQGDAITVQPEPLPNRAAPPVSNVEDAVLAFSESLELVRDRFEKLVGPLYGTQANESNALKAAVDVPEATEVEQDQTEAELKRVPEVDVVQPAVPKENEVLQEGVVPEPGTALKIQEVASPDQAAVQKPEVSEVKSMKEVCVQIATDLRKEWQTPEDIRAAADSYGRIVEMHEILWKELGTTLAQGSAYAAGAGEYKDLRTEVLGVAWRFDTLVQPGEQSETVTLLMHKQVPSGTLPKELRWAADHLGGLPKDALPFRYMGKLLGIRDELTADWKNVEFNKSLLALRVSEAAVPLMENLEVISGRGINRQAGMITGVRPEQRQLLTDLQDASSTSSNRVPEMVRTIAERTFQERLNRGTAPAGAVPNEINYASRLRECMRGDYLAMLFLDRLVTHLGKTNMMPHEFDPGVSYNDLSVLHKP